MITWTAATCTALTSEATKQRPISGQQSPTSQATPKSSLSSTSLAPSGANLARSPDLPTYRPCWPTVWAGTSSTTCSSPPVSSPCSAQGGGRRWPPSAAAAQVCGKHALPAHTNGQSRPTPIACSSCLHPAIRISPRDIASTAWSGSPSRATGRVHGRTFLRAGSITRGRVPTTSCSPATPLKRQTGQPTIMSSLH